MPRPPRIAVLIAALAGVAAWVVFDQRTEAPATKSAAAPQGAATAAESASSAQTPLEIPDRESLEKLRSNPFSTHSRAWPSRPKAVAPSAPPPVAPPLPYRFAGQFEKDSGTEIYLARGDKIFVVKQGETLDGEYRVENVGANAVALLHLPSNTRQTLEFSALRDEAQLRMVQGSGTTRRPEPAPGSPAWRARAARGGTVGEGGQPLAGPASLRWDGPARARSGASFNVSLRLTSDEKVRAAPMQLRFNPEILESVSVRPGRYFGSEKGAFGYRVNPDGSIFVGASNPAAAPASDAEILVLTFKPLKASAATEISVASLNLQGAAGRTIAYSGVAPFRTTVTP